MTIVTFSSLFPRSEWMSYLETDDVDFAVLALTVVDLVSLIMDDEGGAVGNGMTVLLES